MAIRPSLLIVAGAVLVLAIAILGARMTAPALAERLVERANAALGGREEAGVDIRFATRAGSPSRHARLSPPPGLDEGARARIAKTVFELPGVGGAHWTDGSMLARGSDEPVVSATCQDDVQALLRARSIRFEESSAELASGGRDLLDEVAAALRPCFGAVIAITGHTDSSGDEPSNILLSRQRAQTVERALLARNIPSESLRIAGVGSRTPIEGLAPGDPANRRIEFRVLTKKPLVPTPIDTPGAR